MGHLINPISYRLYNIRYWNNNWFSSSNYSFFVNQDILIHLLIKKIVYLFKLDMMGIIFANLKIIRSFHNIFLYIYVHDSSSDMVLMGLKKVGNYMLLLKQIQSKFFKDFRLKSKEKKKLLKKKYLVYLLQYFFSIYFSSKILKVYWKIVKNIFYYFLKKLNKGYFNCKIFILNLSKYNINASLISEFFYIRLKQYYTIWEILKSIDALFNLLKNKGILKGYKFLLAGRFSRKQRATYSWKSVGNLETSSMKSRLDFNYTTIALKYGACTVKVWLRIKKIKPILDVL